MKTPLREHCKVEFTGWATPCWTWQDARTGDGYAEFWDEGKPQYAHRAAWEAEHGPIPKGLVIDHKCRNRACVNEEHLEPVTDFENRRRGGTMKLATADAF